MATENQTPLTERRDRALEKLNAGHEALRKSLDGLETNHAFLGSRWSVWEVLKHLDSVEFVDSFEKLATGEIDTLPSFGSREDRLKQDLNHLETTFQRLRDLSASLSEAQLAKTVTPPNPHNSFPALTMLQLMESVVNHEATHARQIEATRKYVAEFSAKDRAVTFVGLGTGDPSQVQPAVKELVSYADFLAGTDQALEVIRPWIRGLELALRESNEEEVLARLGREARSGQWSLVVCFGDPTETCPRLIDLARQHCDAVKIQSG